LGSSNGLQSQQISESIACRPSSIRQGYITTTTTTTTMGKKSKRQRNKQNNNNGGRGGGSSGTSSINSPAPAAATDDVSQNKNKKIRSHRVGGVDVAEEEEETKDNLRFEDPFVDEIIEETDVIVEKGDDDDDEDEEDDEEDMDQDGPSGSGADGGDVEVIQSWHPLMGHRDTDGDEGEEVELEMDPTAYKMYHTLSPEWPCLSFDLLRDPLGDNRQRFPHSIQAVIGTQADHPQNNSLTCIKLSDLSRLPQPKDDDEDILGDEYDKQDDNDDSDDDDDSDEEDVDLDPILEHYSVPHYGGVNRIRAMPQQQQQQQSSDTIVATWSDVGKVYLYNVQEMVSRFDVSEGRQSSRPGGSTGSTTGPFFVHDGHPTEGYALDWSPVQRGQLASGDNDGNIHIWTPQGDINSDSYNVVPTYEAQDGSGSGNQSTSIEDIQWSPTEATVLCAAEGGSGGYLGVYDTRAPHRPMLRPCLHPRTDINVASWNHLVSNLLATGGDDGTLCVWDLRHFSGQKKIEPLARFSCHKTPVTSCEWHPTDESMLAMSDEVGTYIYDLSVEEDTAPSSSTTQTLVADIPPQLLFCHSGSQQFKEMHWHPQIKSCIMTTAFSGFSVFIPSNL
jgi:ribosome assembly protein RRB1